MKNFLDRCTDLISLHKDMGRQLHGKKLFVIASYGTSLPEDFEATFKQTCDYLGMIYLGTSFLYNGHNNAGLLSLNSHHIRRARELLLLSPCT